MTEEVAKRNPAWTRDELILALDFYFKYTPSIPDKQSEKIAELSDLLNGLASKISGDKHETFRNKNGVYMKLMNFRRFDPNSNGKGLERGGKQEEVVWNLYANHRDELAKAANAIRQHVSFNFPDVSAEVDDDFREADEGRILTRVHTSRERSRKIVEKKKSLFFKKHGATFCEACGFDFERYYGSRGSGFIECHHTKPVSELLPDEKTKLDDLVLLCSNCHRMVHRSKPWLSIDELKRLIKEH